VITVDTAHQFDWLTVPPEAWPKQYAQLEGTQREFNDFVKESARPVTVDFDYDRSKHARYRWWVA